MKDVGRQGDAGKRLRRRRLEAGRAETSAQLLPGGCGEDGLTASGWREQATRVAATVPGLPVLAVRAFFWRPFDRGWLHSPLGLSTLGLSLSGVISRAPSRVSLECSQPF